MSNAALRPALTRRLAALMLLLSPFGTAGIADAQDASWPAAVRLTFEVGPGGDAETAAGIVRTRLEELRPRRTDVIVEDGRVVVRLRSTGDRDLAAGVASQLGDFRIALVASDDNTLIQNALADPARIPEGQQLAPTGERFEPYLLIYAPGRSPDDAILTGAHVRDAAPGMSASNGSSVVNFRFDDAGARALSKLTTDHARERIAIVLDGQVLMAPAISTPISGGSAVIDGGFSVEGAQALAAVLKSGALPAPLTLVEESIEE